MLSRSNSHLKILEIEKNRSKKIRRLFTKVHNELEEILNTETLLFYQRETQGKSSFSSIEETRTHPFQALPFRAVSLT